MEDMRCALDGVGIFVGDDLKLRTIPISDLHSWNLWTKKIGDGSNTTVRDEARAFIEIKPHAWGWKVFEAPGAEPWISGEKSGHLLRGVGPRKAFLRLVLGNDALQLAPDET
jgi:hypothetical protein